MQIPHLPTTDKVYATPQDADVKCGRGRECFRHPGNSLLRIRIAARVQEYQTHRTNAALKVQIVDHVITEFFAEGARFLKRDHVSKLWYDGGIKAARERVGSAFRDSIKPNKVKCMEELKAHFSHIDQYTDTDTELARHYPGASDMFSLSATNSIDTFRAHSPTPIIQAGDDQTNTIETVTTENTAYLPQLRDVSRHDDRPSPSVRLLRTIGSLNDVFQSQHLASGVMLNPSKYDSPDSLQDLASGLPDIGSDEEIYTTTMVEDIDDINQDPQLSQEDKAFLASLDWESSWLRRHIP